MIHLASLVNSLIHLMIHEQKRVISLFYSHDLCVKECDWQELVERTQLGSMQKIKTPLDSRNYCLNKLEIRNTFTLCSLQYNILT